MTYRDFILCLLASPILFINWLSRLKRNWRFWRFSYLAEISCSNCRAPVSLVGIWRCRCGFTYRGHVLRQCPICYSLPRMVRCYQCGVTEKMPEKV
jgi:hypothetical protein